jgi:hypothetical protein
VSSSATICRASAGVCDAAETCTGNADQPCPVDSPAADGTGCSDGSFCNGLETCQSGICTDSADPCFASCDEGTDTCTAECPASPLPSCRTAGRSIFLLRDKSPDSKDRLLWKWVHGQATTLADLGEPPTTTNYALCVYSGASPALLTDAEVQADSQTWRFLGNKGYRFFDFSLSQDGTQKILLKGNADADRSKILWKGRGDSLTDLPPNTLPLTPADFPVTVQVLNNETAACFESTFQQADVKSNREDQLKLSGSNP